MIDFHEHFYIFNSCATWPRGLFFSGELQYVNDNGSCYALDQIFLMLAKKVQRPKRLFSENFSIDQKVPLKAFDLEKAFCELDLSPFEFFRSMRLFRMGIIFEISSLGKAVFEFHMYSSETSRHCNFNEKFHNSAPFAYLIHFALFEPGVAQTWANPGLFIFKLKVTDVMNICVPTIFLITFTLFWELCTELKRRYS